MNLGKEMQDPRTNLQWNNKIYKSKQETMVTKTP